MSSKRVKREIQGVLKLRFSKGVTIGVLSLFLYSAILEQSYLAGPSEQELAQHRYIYEEQKVKEVATKSN